VLLSLLLAACGGAGDTTSEAGSPDADSPGAAVIQIQASRWSYDPGSIELQVGVPVTLELTSSDVHHGFNVPGLNLRADVLPGQTTRLQVVPKTLGTFLFRCDYYCGSGHEGMQGQIVVK
jgi:cytochrome c oxidase subunit 2